MSGLTFALIQFVEYTLFYKKPSSWPSIKSFLLLGHILVLKVSSKFLNLANCFSELPVKGCTNHEYSKLFVFQQTKCFSAS